MLKITSILFGLIPFMALGQIKIIESSTSTTNVDGQTFTVSGNLSSSEFTDYFYVINEGTSSVELKVRRTEVDVMPGTDNATCWKVCPSEIPSGSQVVLVSQFSETIAPGDTNSTFSAHHYLNGIDGCSLYKYEWVDAATLSTVYGTIHIKFDHSSTGCAADLSVSAKELVKMKVYPNPTFGETTIEIVGYTGELTYEVSNLLGQRNLVGNTYLQNEGKVKLSTSSLKEGVYFVTIKANGKLIKTEKLVVKH